MKEKFDKKSLVKILLLLLLFGFVLFTRFWQLDNPDPSQDELSYINDAFKLNIGDPTINPRHHMFHHPTPNFPHPFLVNLLIAYNFRVFGYTLLVARLPIAIFSTLTVITMFLTAFYLFKKFFISFMSATFSAVLPLNIRYARESYLDAALSFFVVTTALFWWLFLSQRKAVYSALAGLTLALAISTKATGVILILPLIVTTFITFRKDFSKYLGIIPALLIGFIVFFIFNSPPAYLDGLLNHPNTKVGNLGIISIAEGLISPKYYSYWLYMIVYNFTVPIILFIIFAINLYLKHKDKRSPAISYLLVFTIVYLVFSISTHLPNSISGPWAYQPEINLLILVSVWGLSMMPSKVRNIVCSIAIIAILPISFIHGFRLLSDPYVSYHNIKFNETNISKIRQDLFQLSGGKKYYIASANEYSEFPEWLYPKNINYQAWENNHPLDAILTDESNNSAKDNPQFTLYKTYRYENLPPLLLYVRR